jgi:anaerobic selenocysteine-containing dehydrogenase
VFHSSGRIDITARVAKSLGLQHGDIVDIMHDRGEWYLYIKYHAPVYGRHEGMAYRSNARGNHFRVWSKALCNAILKECQASDKVKLCVSDPVDLYIYGKALPIIIKYILL